MAIYLNNVIDNHSLLAIQDALRDRTIFQDGKRTAGKTARQVKQNLQADPQNAAVNGAVKLVEKALSEHPTIKQAFYPDRFAKIMISRYEPGMNYGEHVDEALINGVRTDVAFTLFLSDLDSYQGGELEIVKSDGRDHIKLPAGCIYLYPADTIHQVLPVTSGERLAVVGWIQSKIQSPQHRQVLFDLHQALEMLSDSDDNKRSRLQILKAKNNLERMWCA